MFQCDINGDYSWEEESSKCFDHYTKGPCRPGELFLPGGKCGCSPELPHYYHITKSCYEIGKF